MISLDDLQKPVIAVVALGAAATAGFAVGVLVGRDPELARRLVGGLARGFVGARVAFAETMEAVGDFWAEATESAQRDIESERFAAEAVEPVAEATTAVPALAGAGTAASAPARKRKPGVKRAAARKTAARKRPRKATAAKAASRARA